MKYSDNNNRTKVLITGATGNIGIEVLSALKKLDHQLEIYAGVREKEYYNNKPNLSTADTIAVTDGATTANININLDVGGKVTGKVTQADGTTPISDAYVQVQTTSGSYLGYDYTDAAGLYEVNGLSAGTVIVTVSSSGYITEYYNNQTTQAAANTISVALPNSRESASTS